jgi:hypothetical protein
MKGFATVLVAASVFVIVILLLSSNPAENVSYNPNFSEMKVRISNYEVVMLQASQDCNWDKSEIEIRTCVNLFAQDAKLILDAPYTNCQVPNFNVIKSQGTATTQIDCLTEIDSKKGGYFSNQIKKIIKIKKYP